MSKIEPIINIMMLPSPGSVHISCRTNVDGENVLDRAQGRSLNPDTLREETFATRRNLGASWGSEICKFRGERHKPEDISNIGALSKSSKKKKGEHYQISDESYF